MSGEAILRVGEGAVDARLLWKGFASDNERVLYARRKAPAGKGGANRKAFQRPSKLRDAKLARQILLRVLGRGASAKARANHQAAYANRGKARERPRSPSDRRWGGEARRHGNDCGKKATRLTGRRKGAGDEAQ